MRSESGEDIIKSAMKNSVTPRSRLVIIGLCILLMASTVYIIGQSWLAGQQTAELTGVAGDDSPSISVEAGVFRRSAQALTYLDTAKEVDDPRQLAEYQAWRAFEGAPPIIPHPVVEEQHFGENTCLQCHASGGFVAEYEAYAPVVPHPELISCRQCHVAVNSSDLFAESDWQTVAPPEIDQAVLEGSPPPIPHDLQMRENCLACHAGPAAPVEIQVSHPERVNCRQCHVLIESTDVWTR